VHAIERTISRFSDGAKMLLRCERLEPPMSQLGHTRSFGDVGLDVRFARKRTRLGGASRCHTENEAWEYFGLVQSPPCPCPAMADYTHTIDRWDEATGETLIERIAGVGDYQVALETYRAAAKALARRQDHAARWALGWAD
jgi:hypothetical protein